MWRVRDERVDAVRDDAAEEAEMVDIVGAQRQESGAAGLNGLVLRLATRQAQASETMLVRGMYQIPAVPYSK